MLALACVTLFCLYLIGQRADRIHAGRTVTRVEDKRPGSHRIATAKWLPVGKGTSTLVTVRRVGGSAVGSSVRSVTAPRLVSRPVPARGLYRGKSAAYWAGRYRHRTRQLQQARRKLHGAITGPAYGSHWLERAFLCIHAGEGPWAIHNPPYDGGLQMDSDFQRTYGDWALKAFGSAGNWPVSVQLAVAIRAYESGRGFYPWPNTARACGLI